MSPASTDSRRTRELVSAWTRTYGAGSPPQHLDTVAPPDTASRSEADALAAWRRWHDPEQDGRFSSGEWCWYAVIERARVETLAQRHLPGMASNLAHPDTTAPSDSAMAALYHAARNAFAAKANTASILEQPCTPSASHPKWLDKLLTPWRLHGDGARLCMTVNATLRVHLGWLYTARSRPACTTITCSKGRNILAPTASALSPYTTWVLFLVPC
ncbi:hypothetical protein LOKO_01328 [Halomonas chromatireducens]|uniref:Uncharacterized protein n=1 Tax=Halomonas chromatireducens TaxID=507626 RepID=A0A120JVV9_9GAMM|nr:hypothetical protein LOKO_01328 [Halomonas chromatireducens]